jgi:hypothetical protein
MQRVASHYSSKISTMDSQLMQNSEEYQRLTELFVSFSVIWIPSGVVAGKHHDVQRVPQASLCRV